jgi:hypothetical protein
MTKNKIDISNAFYEILFECLFVLGFIYAYDSLKTGNLWEYILGMILAITGGTGKILK